MEREAGRIELMGRALACLWLLLFGCTRKSGGKTAAVHNLLGAEGAEGVYLGGAAGW